jgi:hypothetical protein
MSLNNTATKSLLKNYSHNFKIQQHLFTFYRFFPIFLLNKLNVRHEYFQRESQSDIHFTDLSGFVHEERLIKGRTRFIFIAK